MEKIKNVFLKHISLLQNVLIIALCISASIELSHLWFINLSNGHSIYNRQEKSIAQDIYKQDFITPMRILNSTEYNLFDVIYEGDIYDQINQTYIDMLKVGSDKASFMDVGNDIEKILDNRNLVIFDYPYSIDSGMLQESIGTTKNNYNRIESFDKVCIVVSDGLFNIYFVDTNKSVYYYYTLNDIDLVAEFNNESLAVDSDISYTYRKIETEGKVHYELEANVVEPFNYNYVVRQNPFTTIYGDSPRSLVESKIDKYFRNILYMKFSPNETAYVFSDTDTVVKYFNSGMLEYSYYNIISNAYEYSIVEDYAIAVDFIEHDEDIVNNYYLKDYYRNNFETVFEFSYIVNNYPIVFETGAGYTDTAFSVTVKNNVVTNYKKYVYNFSVSDSTTIVNKSLDDAISVFDVNEADVINDNVMFGYKTYADNDVTDDSKMNLYWFLDVYGNQTSLSTH